MPAIWLPLLEVAAIHIMSEKEQRQVVPLVLQVLQFYYRMPMMPTSDIISQCKIILTVPALKIFMEQTLQPMTPV